MTPPINDLDAAYRAWRDANPQAVVLFRRFAREMLAVRRRFGFRMVAERVRWEVFTTWAYAEGFKINDHYTPYIAREMIEEMPGLASLIETRRVRGARGGPPPPGPGPTPPPGPVIRTPAKRKG